MTASPEETMAPDAAAAVSMLERLSAELGKRQPVVDELDAAYRGDHKLAYLSESFREFVLKRYEGFSDNWCGVVANSPSERLAVIGFEVDDQEGQSDSERALWNTWRANEMDVQSSQGLLESLITARSAVLVWGDPGTDEPVQTWEHPGQVVVAYDPSNPRRRVAALKQWCDDDGEEEYANLYTAEALWKFERPRSAKSALWTPGAPRSLAGRWSPRDVPGEVWPLPNPLGEVPVVEFANRPMLGGDPISEVSGAMAMQQAINLLWTYLFNAADFASLPQRVVMGQEPPKIPILDEAGNIVGEKAVSLDKLSGDRLLWLTGQNTKIGQWDPAVLTQYTDVVEVAVGHLAAQTRTPQHYLIGKMANLSADALKAAETGLVKKVEEAQLFFGAATREVFRLTALAQGDEGLARAARLGTVRWKDAESRSEAQLVDALTKLQTIGFPFEWIAGRYGLSPTEVDRLVGMRDTATARVLSGDLASLVGAKPAPPVTAPQA